MSDHFPRGLRKRGQNIERPATDVDWLFVFKQKALDR
jgi:hypothetical protein